MALSAQLSPEPKVRLGLVSFMGRRSFFPIGVLGCICVLQWSQSPMLLGHYCISATSSGQLFIPWVESVRMCLASGSHAKQPKQQDAYSSPIIRIPGPHRSRVGIQCHQKLRLSGSWLPWFSAQSLSLFPHGSRLQPQKSPPHKTAVSQMEISPQIPSQSWVVGILLSALQQTFLMLQVKINKACHELKVGKTDFTQYYDSRRERLVYA